MAFLRVIFLTAIVLGLMSSAYANVSLKNGNFFIGYTDVVYPGGFEPKVERVYNSKTPYNGIFGWGWGNEYEAYLSVSADGCAVVHEYGGGAENRFCPKQMNSQELDKAVDTIAAAAKATGTLGTSAQFDAYKKRLRSEAMFRNDEWEKYRNAGKLQARQLAVNSQLISNRFSFQYITRIQGGFVRTFDNGRVEKFDDSGRLQKVSDKNNNSIEFGYTKEGKLAKIVDNFNRKIFLSYNKQGKVEKLQGENSKEATYKYNDQGELVWTKDVDGNVYTYKYSTDRRHNMVEIGYSDKTTLQIAYYGRDKNENVKSVKDRDGSQNEYVYLSDKSDRKHTGVSITVKDTEGKKISSSKYEYFLRNKADGEEWTYKMITELDGERTETTYNECCGLPLIIKKGGEETAFEYDIKGRVTKKVTPSEITMLKYDPKAGKVSRVDRSQKGGSKKTFWSEFQYDPKANLVFARNSEGKGVKLLYDNNGRITTMVDQNRRKITFKYNENSKPVEITDPALGSITVSYSNSGEIKKVDSSAGRKIAMQVTSAFQNLLEIIRPAGVTLSF